MTRLVAAFLVAAAAATVADANRPRRPSAGRRSAHRDHDRAGARAEATTGMVYVAISRDNKRTPIEQARPPARRSSRIASTTSSPARRSTLTGADRGHPRRQPPRHPGRRILDAAVRQRLHAVRARRRQDGVAAHGSVGGPGLEAVARQRLRRSGTRAVRPAVDDADPPRRRQGDSADPAAGGHRARQAHQDREQDPLEVVGASDLPRRDRAAAEGLRQPSRRPLSRSTTSRGTSRLRAPGGFGTRRRVRHVLARAPPRRA